MTIVQQPSRRRDSVEPAGAEGRPWQVNAQQGAESLRRVADTAMKSVEDINQLAQSWVTSMTDHYLASLELALRLVPGAVTSVGRRQLGLARSLTVSWMAMAEVWEAYYETVAGWGQPNVAPTPIRREDMPAA